MNKSTKVSLAVIALLVTILTFMLGRYSVSGQFAAVNSRLDKLETIVAIQIPNIANNMSRIEANMVLMNSRLDVLAISSRNQQGMRVP